MFIGSVMPQLISWFTECVCIRKCLLRFTLLLLPLVGEVNWHACVFVSISFRYESFCYFLACFIKNK
jgi:hypothetical protein